MTSAPVAPVIDQLTAARRRLTNALRLGADTAKHRAEVAMLERRVADDAADAAANNAAAARSRDRAVRRRFASFVRFSLRDLLASVAALCPENDARDALKPDMIAGHRAAVTTFVKSSLAMEAASSSIPASNVDDLAKCISALDSRRQEIAARRARGEHHPNDDSDLILLEKDRADLTDLHAAAEHDFAQAKTADAAATEVFWTARQALEALEARMRLTVLVDRQLALDNQATAVAAQVRHCWNRTCLTRPRLRKG